MQYAVRYKDGRLSATYGLSELLRGIAQQLPGVDLFVMLPSPDGSTLTYRKVGQVVLSFAPDPAVVPSPSPVEPEVEPTPTSPMAEEEEPAIEPANASPALGLVITEVIPATPEKAAAASLFGKTPTGRGRKA